MLSLLCVSFSQLFLNSAPRDGTMEPYPKPPNSPPLLPLWTPPPHPISKHSPSRQVE